jgi:hypothetical protein
MPCFDYQGKSPSDRALTGLFLFICRCFGEGGGGARTTPWGREDARPGHVSAGACLSLVGSGAGLGGCQGLEGWQCRDP